MDHTSYLYSNNIEQVSKIDNYKILKLLGDGTYSKVYLAEESKSSKKVALKIFKNKYFSENVLKKEFTLQKISSHPNVLKVFNYGIDKLFYNMKKKKSKNASYLTMEYLNNCDLFSLLDNSNPFSETSAKEIIKQLISAISHLHEKKVIHCDIKPENILFDEKFNVKLIDFGLSVFHIENYFENSFHGTRAYMAPEIIEKKGFSFQADIFSLGVLLFIIVTKSFPFNQASRDDKYYQYFFEGKFELFWTIHKKFLLEEGIELTNEFIDLVTQMLLPNPNERITINEIINHSWFDRNCSEIYLEEIRKKKKHIEKLTIRNKLMQALEKIKKTEEKKMSYSFLENKNA